MASDLPRVKLVFILREPTDRAFSNYVWTRMHGHETEELGAALRLEDERRERSAGGPEVRAAVFLFQPRICTRSC